ncbi:MAG: FtsH protease activity modulator HflK [Desulfobacterales bacterium]|jgi:membrane protease subunit HflK
MSWDWDKLKDQQDSRGIKPPQVDELLQSIRKIKLPGGPLLLIAVLAIVVIATSIYTVQVEEVGVVQRFGKFVRITQPGLRFKLPFGVETVRNVKVRLVLKEEFGVTSDRASGRGRFAGPSENNNETLMLTGDLNVAIVPWIVQYRIKDPYQYLFKVQDVTRLLRDMSEASMRLVVGDRSINEVITKRDAIAVEARNVLQEELDAAESGIQIVTIEMKRTNVPVPVQPSFNEVNQAVQEKEQLIYQAREDYNKAIPAAKGEADRVIKSAEGYGLDRINRAKGDAARFTSIYSEYSKAPDVTRRRMYLETIKEVLPKLGNKFIIDSEQNNLLPLLNIGQQPIQLKSGGTE